MDIATLKEKLEPSEFEELTQHVEKLVAKADTAVSESISQRKGLKAENERLKTLNAQIMEKLGIVDAEELDTLPDLKGQADAAKQYEVKMKRLERDLAEKNEALNQLTVSQRRDRQAALLAKAMQSHEWINPEVVQTFVSQGITWEDETPFYQTKEGKLVSLDEGAKLIAQTMPELLKSRGAGGSGYNPANSGGIKNPFAKETFNLTEQGRLYRENPALAESLKAGA